VKRKNHEATYAALSGLVLGLIGALIPVSAQTKKPDILVIFGDDIGYSNISAYDLGKGAGPRKEFFYWTDDGDLAGLRYDKWKLFSLNSGRTDSACGASRRLPCACR
jgi:hypothetical protein